MLDRGSRIPPRQQNSLRRVPAVKLEGSSEKIGSIWSAGV